MCAVAAHADADRKRPPQWRNVDALGLHSQQDRNHGCGERNIVNQGGEDGCHPHQNQGCGQEVLLDERNDELADVLEEMTVLDTTDHDK